VKYGTQKRCSGSITTSRPCPSCPIISQTCDQLETYQRWQALTAADFQLVKFTPALRTSPTATGASREHTLDTDRPKAVMSSPWDFGTETLPPRIP